MNSNLLPINRAEMARRGWDHVDVALVTADAYIDHPSFGVSLIARWLEAHGYKVGIIAQPRHDRPDDFKALGRPRLFFGVTSGNLDSVVANYTGNCRVRTRDAYSPDGDPYFPGQHGKKAGRRRPDRAVIRYVNLIRQAFGDVPVIAGGLEASLRRFIHYDYQQERLRGSILSDSKADLLVYGMGERAVLEAADRLAAGRGLSGIAGTCERLGPAAFGRLSASALEGQVVILPSWKEIAEDPARFLDAELMVDAEARAAAPRPIAQQQKSGIWVVQHPRARALSQEELDRLYELPYSRMVHPAFGQVPAYRMIRHSVTVVRGCSGNCAFCAISRHQGPRVVSRSPSSVMREIEAVSKMPDFRGTITDLGGPTANLYGIECPRIGRCSRRDCLYPRPCPHLKISGRPFRELLSRAAGLPGVRHVFVSSGLRMDLLVKTPGLLAQIMTRHTPGALKIAPEHTEDEVLSLMHKPGGGLLERFLALARGLERGRGCEITAYLMTAHPGCTLSHTKAMARKLRRLRLPVRQFQDFTPTPGTLSTAMYVTGLDCNEKRPIYVARKGSERRAQRKVLEALMKRR